MTELQLTEVRAGYRGADVLRGVTLRVGSGECLALVGANGAGKSTLLRAISGLLRVRGGGIALDGRDISRLPPHAIARLGVGHVAEGRRILATMTVRGNLELAARFAVRHPDGVEFSVADAFERWPILREKNADPAGSLSGGQQQILAIAQVLVASPRIVVLDEPTAGLAPIMIDEVSDAIRILLDAGIPVLLVEQTIELADELCTRFAVLRRGEITYAGDRSGLADRSRLLAAYVGGDDAG